MGESLKKEARRYVDIAREIRQERQALDDNRDNGDASCLAQAAALRQRAAAGEGGCVMGWGKTQAEKDQDDAIDLRIGAQADAIAARTAAKLGFTGVARHYGKAVHEALGQADELERRNR